MHILHCNIINVHISYILKTTKVNAFQAGYVNVYTPTIVNVFVCIPNILYGILSRKPSSALLVYSIYGAKSAEDRTPVFIFIPQNAFSVFTKTAIVSDFKISFLKRIPIASRQFIVPSQEYCQQEKDTEYNTSDYRTL